MSLQNSRILIVGLGLIGGSIAKGLSKKGCFVSGIDIDENSIKYGIENKYIINDDFEDNLIKKADIIIVCLYPKMVDKWIKDHQYLMKNKALISDVTGIKENIVERVQTGLRSDLEFLAMHPMAGKEVKGVTNSDDNIFNGANLIIVPSKKNKEQSIKILEEIGKLLNFANITILSPKEHDQMISYLSTLPHALAVALMNANYAPHLYKYTGDSFRDLTRIAKINTDLWTELFFENKNNLIDDIEVLEKELNKIKNALNNNDEETLKKLFENASSRRKMFDK